jgi:hypothetical protein
MAELQAQRRLVKSPPELWAEVSDAASLARHLGEVGEITITRLEPETTVAWEGERASGTVEIEPAGWGTKVTLTAEPVAIAESEPVVEPEPEPEPVAAAQPEPEPVAAEPAPTQWFATFLRRFRRRTAEQAATTEPGPSAADDGRAGGAEAGCLCPTPSAEAPAPATGPARSSAGPEPVEPEPATDPLLKALTGALDSLGAAHHRPFSRG